MFYTYLLVIRFTGKGATVLSRGAVLNRGWHLLGCRSKWGLPSLAEEGSVKGMS